MPAPARSRLTALGMLQPLPSDTPDGNFRRYLPVGWRKPAWQLRPEFLPPRKSIDHFKSGSERIALIAAAGEGWSKSPKLPCEQTAG